MRVLCVDVPLLLGFWTGRRDKKSEEQSEHGLHSAPFCIHVDAFEAYFEDVQ